MWKTLLRATVLFVSLALLTGILYPLIVTGAAQLIFPNQANGSVIRRNGKAIGSSLIGQNFQGARYFHGRPSVADYDALKSGGSNLAQTNHQLLQSIKNRANQFRKENGLTTKGKVPSDLVTASGSGLDPHISPLGALLQVPRVAKARGLNEKVLRELVHQCTEQPFLGVFGSARVNVLRLNLELDSMRK